MNQASSRPVSGIHEWIIAAALGEACVFMANDGKINNLWLDLEAVDSLAFALPTPRVGERELASERAREKAGLLFQGLLFSFPGKHTVHHSVFFAENKSLISNSTYNLLFIFIEILIGQYLR